MSSSPVLLILGAGPNVGKSVAQKFAANGYKVALASRRVPTTNDFNESLHVKSDLSKPEGVKDIFQQVREKVGVPSVVLYNTTAQGFWDKENPFKYPLDTLDSDLDTNAVSLLSAIQQSTEGFEELPATTSKVFFYTGNFTNTNPKPPLLSSGIGKAIGANLMQYSAVASQSKGKDWNFYYVDERRPDGDAVYGDINGEAHADHLLELAGQKEQQPWWQTFVKGKGYVKFEK